MKKKGLIISTIVMMLVVVVAISTATYAWFQVSADAKISTLTVQTASSDGLQIAAMYDRGSGVAAASGDMTLNPGANKTWDGSANDYGADLVFATALSAAYGVTGNGLQANMYTAASQSVTAYATLPVTDDWFKTKVDPTTGEPSAEPEAIEQGIYQVYNFSVSFYTNAEGTQPAAGSNFNNGKYSGLDKDEDYVDGVYDLHYVVWYVLTNNGVNDPEAPAPNNVKYYVRALGYDNTKVTAGNAPTYLSNTDTIYYTDNAATVLVADEALKFAGGKYIGAVAGDLVGLYVRNVLFRQIMDEAEATALIGTAPATVFYTNSICTALANNDSVSAGVYTPGVVSDLVGLYYDTDPGWTADPDEVAINWSYEPNNNAINGTGNIPHHLILAKPNIEYFQLNFALRTQRAVPAGGGKTNTADIFFKKLSVMATGGMAASARIALFEYGTNAYNPAAGVSLKQVFVPFATSTEVDNSWSATPGNFANTDNQYNLVPDHVQCWKANGFAYNAAKMGAFDVAKVRESFNIARDASDVWQSAEFFNIDKNVDWNSASLYAESQDDLDGGGNKTKEMMSIGSFQTANAVKYYQLVIWFEGTDAQCKQLFAGSGVTVDIAFDFYQRWDPAATGGALEGNYYTNPANGFPQTTGFVAD